MAGVYITRGMGIRIPAGGLILSVNSEGGVDSSIRMQVSLDMAPYWLEIAVARLIESEAARRDLVRCVEADLESDKAGALEREFSSGMQALTSSVIALDALYASVRDRVGLPDSLVATWREKRTARHRQVAEVFHRAFLIKGAGFKNLKNILSQLYKFRDLAVHPLSEFSDPVFHPVLQAGTEWRFVSFGFDSAHTAVRAGLSVILQLARCPRAKKGPFPDYCASLSERLRPIEK